MRREATAVKQHRLSREEHDADTKRKNTNANGNDRGNTGKNQKNTKAGPGVGAV